MILPWLVLVPIIGGVLAWIAARWSDRAPRWICIAAFALEMLLLFAVAGAPAPQVGAKWLAEFHAPWIPQFGISFYFAVDGLSLVLLFLSAFLGLIAVATSWTEIKERVGFFHLNLMWVMSGIIGIFISFDLFLFYFFWELMLVPMYFLIAIWGHENRRYAAFKFFLFTQGPGLLLLLAILGLYFVNGRATGVYTFNYDHHLLHPVLGKASIWLMLGFALAYLVKLPAVPFHTWLPDAHTEAPTAGSVILAGLLLKTGAYGILRFVLPIFPEASRWFAPIAMVIGVVGIIYGAVLAFAQVDFKRLVAYTSVSHMGFVLLGAYAFNMYGLQGVVLQMVCHGLGTGALFVLVGALQERLHTRDMREFGGLWDAVPRMSGFAMFFAMAALGLPGLGNFVAEFLSLIGAFRYSPIIAAIAAVGLVYATVYSLWMIQLVFHGQAKKVWNIADLSIREWLIFGSMAIGLIWLGLYPQPAINAADQPLRIIRQNIVTEAQRASSVSPAVIPTRRGVGQ